MAAGFFHHLLDVINPLQHLPVIGTIYRAITGEHIGAVEKVMGDALYGGLWGAASSVADLAFEGVTGHSLEDTVLGWFSHDSGTRLASVKVAAPNISSSTLAAFRRSAGPAIHADGIGRARRAGACVVRQRPVGQGREWRDGAARPLRLPPVHGA